mgnify:CR=1 FL=1
MTKKEKKMFHINDHFHEHFKDILYVELKDDNREINILTKDFVFSFFLDKGKWNYGGMGILSKQN